MKATSATTVKKASSKFKTNKKQVAPTKVEKFVESSNISQVQVDNQSQNESEAVSVLSEKEKDIKTHKSRQKTQGRRIIPSSLQKLKPSVSSWSRSTNDEPNQFILSMLNRNESHFIADEESEEGDLYGHIAPGLEVLTSLVSLRITKRLLNFTPGNKDVLYRAYCQYDIRNRNSMSARNVAIGIETATCSSAFCCLDSRLFDIRLYDYKTELIVRIQRRWSCSFCLAKYYLFCCWCGWNGCGNKIEVYDSYNDRIGTVKQCSLFTKRLIYLQEANVSIRGRPRFTWKQIFCEVCRVWRDLKVKKFDVMNAEGKAEVRIEQYLPGGNLFKFIYLEEIFNAGYCRRAGVNEYNLELWKYFSENQKAVMISACFLMDHVCFNISLDSSYRNKIWSEEEDEMCSRRCHRWCHFNRFRRIQFIILAVIIVSVIFYFLFKGILFSVL